MTNESSRSRLRDFHGCMSGVLHLFDFNQALSGRKILPTQKFPNELETPRDSVDIRSRVVIKDSNEENKGMPNVVARLMGLDKMPEDSSLVDQSGRNTANASICIDKKQQTGPFSLFKSRSVHTLNETPAPSPQNAESQSGKLKFRSRSFREHPHERQLEEFKKEFEASQALQYRGRSQRIQQEDIQFKQSNFQKQAKDEDDLFLRDKFVDLKKSPARERRKKSTEFLDALEYIQKNDEVFLKVFRDPNALIGNHIHRPCLDDADKASVQEYVPSWNVKELVSPRFAGSKIQSEVILPLQSRSNSPSQNSSNPLPATIVVLKTNRGNAEQANLKLKYFEGEAKQSSKDTSKGLRNNREIAREKVKKLKENNLKRLSKEVDTHEDSASISSFRRRMLPRMTTSRGELSVNGEEAPLTPKKLSNCSGKSSPSLQNSPRLGKSMEEIKKESKKVSVKKKTQCQRSFEEKKVSSRSHSTPRGNRDIHVHDSIASTAFASTNDRATVRTTKKGSSYQNLALKGKSPSRKGALSLNKSKDTNRDGITKAENSQAIVPNSLVSGAGDNIQAIFQECPDGNTLDRACGDLADGVDEKCEHPSPVSVLDGPFQQESPSPINLKDSATEFQELRTKLCLLKLNTKDTRNSGEDRQTHHTEEGMLSLSRLFKEERSLAAQEEMAPCKSLPIFKMESPDFESLRVDDIASPEGKQANLLYVRNVLVSAGLNTDNILAFTRWYSPSHPIDPHVFDRLENYYRDLKADSPCINSSSKCQACEKSKHLPDVLNRKLMFELVDEILCKKIKPCLNTRAWVNPTKPNLPYMSTGKQLLREVWDEICRFPEAYCEILEDVEALIGRDMANEAPWAGDIEDVEKIGFEVEQLIFNYLLEDALVDLLSVKY